MEQFRLWKAVNSSESFAGRLSLAELGRLRLWYLLHLARPAHIRQLYRRVCTQPPKSLMELGIIPQRTLTLLQIIRHAAKGICPRYVAVDEFECGQNGAPVSLKAIYRMLRRFDIEPRLLPGSIESIPASWANQITDVDLVVIWHDINLNSGSRAQLLLPRMLSPTGEIWCQRSSQGRHHWLVITKAELERLGKTSLRHRAA
jgi:hypothetical protein